MKNLQEYEKDLSSIRHIMERSVKFISLSGLSGVLAGIYALVGAAAVYFMRTDLSTGAGSYNNDVRWKLVGIALAVLVPSVITGILFSQRKAKKAGISLWNTTSKRLFTNLFIPLAAGGIFILLLMYHGLTEFAAPACLVFYGLALLQVSDYTYDEIRYLGFCEIVLGLIAAFAPEYGLVLWAAGFGVLHIVYGALMHFRYDR